MSSTLAGPSRSTQAWNGPRDGVSDQTARLAGIVGGLVFSVAGWAAIVVGVEAMLRLI